MLEKLYHGMRLSLFPLSLDFFLLFFFLSTCRDAIVCKAAHAVQHRVLLAIAKLGSCLLEKKLIWTFGFWFSLACHQVIFFAFLSGFGFPSVVRIVVPTFLKCWASIALALVTRFK